MASTIENTRAVGEDMHAVGEDMHAVDGNIQEMAPMMASNETRQEKIEQHSVPKTIFLHLLPGVVITGLFMVFAPPLKAMGWPTLLFTFTICGSVVLLATLGHLLYQGKKRNGKLSLQGIVLYRKAMPWWQYVLFALLMNVYAVALLLPFSPLQNVITSWFTWWPVYSLRFDTGHYPATHYLISTVMYIALNGLIGPIIEELYFRGYLLPRISRFGAWAPFINMALFSLYHFWQPWNNVINIVALWPLAFLPWLKKNVYLGMVLHCSLNIVGMLIPLLISMLLKH